MNIISESIEVKGMKEVHFSKSKYCSAVQCPKMLWLRNNKSEEFDDSILCDTVLDNGNDVGDLAMGLFGDYTEVPFSSDLGEMIEKTSELVKAGTSVICEASFSYDGCYCAVDILRKVSDGYEIYEVKSSTKVKDIFIDDAAYQNWVLKNSGINVVRVSIVYINNKYVRHGELDLDQLFVIEDVTEAVDAKFAEVAERIAYLREYLSQTSEPSDDIGPKCNKPYGCGFWKYCTRSLPSPNVFDLGNERNKWKFYEKGLISFKDLLKAGVLKEEQKIQAQYEVEEREPYVDRKAIDGFLGKLSYPLYFLDFESFQPAVPLYDDSTPYQQIPFQYSLHWIEKEGGELKHTEFLAYPGGDPRRSLAEQLCRDIPLGVCTTAYNMTFEKTRLKELASIYPDLSDHLLDIRDHIVDLMEPFDKKWYYTRAMKGSYSIKYVLPALYPDDPQLDYHNLEGVHNGTEASATFLAMQNMSGDELEEWRSHLLKYCGLDTYAMVKVWERLCEVAKC